MIAIRFALNWVTWLCVAVGYAAVAKYVALPYHIAFAVLCAAALLTDSRRIPRIPRWALNIFAFGVLVHAFYRIGPETLIEPILDALTLLTAVKLLEEKQFRDYMQIYALCMFLLVGSSFISLSSIFLLYFLAIICLSTPALMFLAYFSRDPEMRVDKTGALRLCRQAAVICLFAVPLTAFFFIILPRTSFPLLSFLNGWGGSGRTGFSDQVALGDVSEIQESADVAFRVEMERIGSRALYWRGIVLDAFDGTSWKSSDRDEDGEPKPPAGAKISQTIFLEPYGYNRLFALDRPLSVSLIQTRRSSNMTFTVKNGVPERIRYTATSVITDAVSQPKIDIARYLALPNGLSPQIGELVEKISETAGDDDTLIHALTGYFRREEYRYTLKSIPVSSRPVEDFLFRDKIGNCEYFASALAVMLRTARIPARLVGGYRGGTYNPAGPYYLVRRRDAHVWVEAYTSAGAWIRLDPTPAAPEGSADGAAAQWLARVGLLLDTFNYYWNKAVVGYDLSSQLKILRKLRETVHKPVLQFRGPENIDFKPLILPVAGLCVLGGVTWFVFGLLRTNRHERLLSAFFRRMASRGYRRKPNEGLDEFASRIAPVELRRKTEAFLLEFQRRVYRDEPLKKSETRRLRALMKEL